MPQWETGDTKMRTLIVNAKVHMAEDLKQYLLGQHGVKSVKIEYPSVGGTVDLAIAVSGKPLPLRKQVDLAVMAYIFGRSQAV